MRCNCHSTAKNVNGQFPHKHVVCKLKYLQGNHSSNVPHVWSYRPIWVCLSLKRVQNIRSLKRLYITYRTITTTTSSVMLISVDQSLLSNQILSQSSKNGDNGPSTGGGGVGFSRYGGGTTTGRYCMPWHAAGMWRVVGVSRNGTRRYGTVPTTIGRFIDRLYEFGMCSATWTVLTQ